jgi:hypothetical protein
VPQGLDETVESFRLYDSPQHFCDKLEAQSLHAVALSRKGFDISAEYLKIHRISVNFLYFDEYQSK